MKSKGTLQLSASIVVFAFCVPLLYVGGYLAMLTPREIDVASLFPGMIRGYHTREVLWREPRYRFADEQMQLIFQPAHWVDKRWRPNYWGDEATFMFRPNE